MSHPYLTRAGVLVIPFDCDRRYRWWAGGQSILRTVDELGAPPAVRNAHDPDLGRDGGYLSPARQAAISEAKLEPVMV